MAEGKAGKARKAKEGAAGVPGLVFATMTNERPESGAVFDQALAASPDGRWVAAGRRSDFVVMDLADALGRRARRDQRA